MDQHDAEDLDHFPEKLRDIQDEYQAVSSPWILTNALAYPGTE